MDRHVWAAGSLEPRGRSVGDDRAGAPGPLRLPLVLEGFLPAFWDLWRTDGANFVRRSAWWLGAFLLFKLLWAKLQEFEFGLQHQLVAPGEVGIGNLRRQYVAQSTVWDAADLGSQGRERAGLEFLPADAREGTDGALQCSDTCGVLRVVYCGGRLRL